MRSRLHKLAMRCDYMWYAVVVRAAHVASTAGAQLRALGAGCARLFFQECDGYEIA